MRGTPTVLMLGLLCQACVIYEERVTDDTACPPDIGAPATPRPGDTDAEPEPDPEPIVLDLYLTDDDGAPGEVLLSTLVARDGGVAPGRVQEVHFERDVSVSDAIVRDDEVVLLLSVAADAQPGLADVYVTLDDGTAGLLAEPFRILEADAGGDDPPPADTGIPSTGGGGSTDTGTPPVDTGRPPTCSQMPDTSDTGC